MKLFSLSLISLALSVSTAQAAIQILKPGAEGKDAQLVGAFGNFGNYEYITGYSAVNGRNIGLIEFALSSIPSGATINSARLSLFHIYNSNPDRIYNLFQVTSAWDEATVTFPTRPTHDAVVAASMTIPNSGRLVYRDWDVTDLVSGWVNGSFSNYGMWLEGNVVPDFTNAYFSSSDDIESHRPMLTIDYTPAAVPEPMSLLVWAGLAFVGLTIVKRCKI